MIPKAKPLTVGLAAAASLVTTNMTGQTVVLESRPTMPTFVYTRPVPSTYSLSTISVSVSGRKFLVPRARSNATPTPTPNPIREELMTKLLAISDLEDGWDGPDSIAVRGPALAAYQSFIHGFGSPPIDLEPIPTPAGGIRMEWDRGETSYIVELEATGGMFLCTLGPTVDVEYEQEFDAVDITALTDFFRGGNT